VVNHSERGSQRQRKIDNAKMGLTKSRSSPDQLVAQTQSSPAVSWSWPPPAVHSTPDPYDRWSCLNVEAAESVKSLNPDAQRKPEASACTLHHVPHAQQDFVLGNIAAVSALTNDDETRRTRYARVWGNQWRPQKVEYWPAHPSSSLKPYSNSEDPYGRWSVLKRQSTEMSEADALDCDKSQQQPKQTRGVGSEKKQPRSRLAEPLRWTTSFNVAPAGFIPKGPRWGFSRSTRC